MRFGDLVEYDLTASHGGQIEQATVIGEPGYSDGTVVMLATEKAIGMPINVRHCRVIASGNESPAEELRARYAKKFPGALKPR